MQEMNCLIIEDEKLAADLISEYIREVPGLNLTAICQDVFSAMEVLHKTKVDVLFLDINLPKVNGLEFIRTLSSRQQVILTTAYHQHAIEAFDLDVTDYLLKPIEFSRFLQAVNKARIRSTTDHSQDPSPRRCFYFNVDKKKVKVTADEIIYIESIKEYVKIHTAHTVVITRMNISDVTAHLGEDMFLRVHKSFVVNSNRITAYTAAEIELGTVKVPIGRSFSDAVTAGLSAGGKATSAD